ncbi:MAG: N-acetyltransferase family protein [Gaiellaceae bacterium]
MELRRAEPDDAAAVAAVYVASFETLTFLPTLHTTEEHRRFVATLIETQEVWVAEEAGRIVGMAGLSADMLSQLYVDPAAQGRGVGSALLDVAKRRRPAGFTFWVFQDNARARAFYEARSCRVVRLTDGSGNEEKTPDALYEWKPD